MIINDYKDLNEKVYSTFGLVLRKLGNDYSFIDNRGRMIFKETFSRSQVEEIIRFLSEGCFEGMFRNNSLSHYEASLAVHFDAIEDTLPKESRGEFKEAKNTREFILKKYYVDQTAKSIKQEAQPEA